MIKSLLIIFFAMVANAAFAQREMNNSGTLLAGAPSSLPEAVGALTLNDNSSRAAFERDYSATPLVPNESARDAVFAPEFEHVSSSVIFSAGLSPANELQPLAEPAVWCAAALATAAALWHRRHRPATVRPLRPHAPAEA